MAALVGRELEQAWLRARLRDADRGDRQIVLLTGEPGIGKTALVGDLVEAAAADGWRIRRVGDAAQVWPALEGTHGEPAVVVLDDAEECDPGFLDHVDHVDAGAPLSRRALVIVCARNTSWAGRAGRGARRLALGGLTVAQVGAFATDHGRTLNEWETAALAAWSGGNPSYLDVLIRCQQLPPPTLPAELIDVLNDRLGSLSPEARALADVIAIANGALPLAGLAELAGVGAETSAAVVDELRRAGLVGPAVGGLRLQHEAMRRHVLQLAADRDDPVIARSVDSLARADADDPEVAESIALLGRLAPDRVDGERWHRAVLVTSTAALTDNEPRRVLDHAGALVARRSLGESTLPLRAEAMVLLGDAQHRVGDWRAAGDAYTKAAQLARRCSRPDLLARVALGMPRFVDETHIDLQVRDLVSEALGVVPADDHATRALLLARLAGELPFADTAGRVELCNEALDAARTAGRAVLIEVLKRRVATLQAPDLSADRMKTVRELVALANEDGDPELVFQATTALFGVCLESALMAEADAAVESLRRQAGVSKARHHEAHALLRHAALSFVRGQFDLALEGAGSAAGIARSAGLVDAARMAGILMASVWHMRGEKTAAELMRSRAATDPLPGFAYAYFLHQAGDVTDARAEAHRGLAQLQDGSMPLMAGCMVTGADIADSFEDRSIAAVVLEPLATATVRLIITSGIVCAGPIEQFRGHALSALGRHDEAIAAFERAVDVSREIGSGPFTVRAGVGLVRSLVRRGSPGDAARAAALADEAKAQAEVFGMGAVPRILDAALAPVAVVDPHLEPGGSAAAERARQRAELTAAKDVWTLTIGGRVTHLKHTKGLGQLATLLEARGREVASATLAGTESEPAATVRTEVLDDGARRAYRRRLAELDAQRQAATAAGDAELEERLEREQSALVSELRRLTGLNGRARTFNDEDERARVNVTRTLRAAVERIFASEPDFGVHLAQSIRTGARCAYVPADEDTTWTVTIRR